MPSRFVITSVALLIAQQMEAQARESADGSRAMLETLRRKLDAIQKRGLSDTPGFVQEFREIRSEWDRLNTEKPPDPAIPPSIRASLFWIFAVFVFLNPWAAGSSNAMLDGFLGPFLPPVIFVANIFLLIAIGVLGSVLWKRNKDTKEYADEVRSLGEKIRPYHLMVPADGEGSDNEVSTRTIVPIPDADHQRDRLRIIKRSL